MWSLFLMVQGPNQLSFLTMKKLHSLKTVLVGDSNVGKTSLANRFVKGKFGENDSGTIADVPLFTANMVSKNVVLGDGCVVQFNIWDTAGQERYRSLVPIYLRGANIAFIVYDVTNSESFVSVSYWLDTLQHYCDKAIPVLVANKCDCESIVEDEIALSFAASKSLQFVQTSAKTGENVDDLFLRTGEKVVDELKHETKSPEVIPKPVTPVTVVPPDMPGKERKKCC